MFLSHKIDHAVLAVQVEAWLLVDKIRASDRLACVKDILHAAVTFSLLETLLKCVEIVEKCPLRQLNVF